MQFWIELVLLNGFFGFMTAFSGNFIGGAASFFIKDRNMRMKGAILGFLGGLTLGIVFFDLLPEALVFGSIETAMAGTIIGLFLAVLIDGKLESHETGHQGQNGNHFFKAMVLMAIGVGIHNLPSGLALGSLLANSPKNGFYLAIALILHGIPEGLTLGVFLRECRGNILNLVLISVLISLPMGLGSALGGILRTPFILCFSLSFAGSMILYVTLRETLPAANSLWPGRLTTIGNVLGILLGMLLITILAI